MKRKVSCCDHPIGVPGMGVKYWDTETAFQIYVANWLRRNGYRFHHSANERAGGRSGLLAKLKGQSSGMPDLLIFAQPCVAIELKVGDGKVSQSQIDWLEYLEGLGWTCAVCRCFEEVVI